MIEEGCDPARFQQKEKLAEEEDHLLRNLTEAREAVEDEQNQTGGKLEFNELFTRLWPWDIVGVEQGEDKEQQKAVHAAFTKERKDLATKLEVGMTLADLDKDD